MSLGSRIKSRGIGRAFRHRDFVIYALCGFVGNIGIWVQRLGVQWLAWELTHSYAWLGAVSFVDAIGIIILLPVFGTMVDRSDRLKMMRIAQILVTLLAVALAALTLSGSMTIWLVVAAMAVHGVLDALWAPARLAMTPSLVPREDLPAAIGFNASTFNLAQILGPALGGLIISAFTDHVFGIGILFAIATATYLVYLAGLYLITQRYEEKVSSGGTGFLADVKEGVLYTFQKPGLALYLGMMLATALIMRPVRELLAGFADGVFQQGPTGLAMLTSGIGVGALVGALVIANVTRVKGLTRTVLIVLFSAIAVQFAFVLAPTFEVAVGAIALIGATIAMGGIGSQVLIQSAIHGAMRGRVVAIWSLIMRAGPPIGAWIIGATAEFTGLKWAFAGATALYLVLFLAMLPKFATLARNMETVPEEEDERKPA